MCENTYLCICLKRWTENGKVGAHTSPPALIAALLGDSGVLLTKKNRAGLIHHTYIIHTYISPAFSPRPSRFLLPAELPLTLFTGTSLAEPLSPGKIIKTSQIAPSTEEVETASLGQGVAGRMRPGSLLKFLHLGAVSSQNSFFFIPQW